MTDMDDLAQILREGNAAEERRYEAEKRHREDIMDKIAEDSENRQRQREMDRIQRQMANDETNRNLGEIKGYMAGVSNRIDVMREDLLQGMKGLAITVAQSAAAICAKLDAL
ncbi:MAG: hypothetical protein LBG73_05905, partial [Spirochaetaceae bacterium]|nr:hypothetical protein [Spirochaetaceae bacterium]